MVAAVDCGAVIDFDDARHDIQQGLRAGLHDEVDHADTVRAQIREIKQFYGIREQCLETLIAARA